MFLYYEEMRGRGIELSLLVMDLLFYVSIF